MGRKRIASSTSDKIPDRPIQPGSNLYKLLEVIADDIARRLCTRVSHEHPDDVAESHDLGKKMGTEA